MTEECIHNYLRGILLLNLSFNIYEFMNFIVHKCSISNKDCHYWNLLNNINKG